MVSRKGQAIRFGEQDVRSMGRSASGVQGMRLRGDGPSLHQIAYDYINTHGHDSHGQPLGVTPPLLRP